MWKLRDYRSHYRPRELGVEYTHNTQNMKYLRISVFLLLVRYYNYMFTPLQDLQLVTFTAFWCQLFELVAFRHLTMPSDIWRCLQTSDDAFRHLTMPSDIWRCLQISDDAFRHLTMPSDIWRCLQISDDAFRHLTMPSDIWRCLQTFGDAFRARYSELLTDSLSYGDQIHNDGCYKVWRTFVKPT